MSKQHTKVINMLKKALIALLCTVTLSLALSFVPVYASDLPIDITAIGRQDFTSGRITTRIGAHLFTEDAQRINEILAQQIQRQQDAVLYLFATVPYHYEIDPHVQIMKAANELALFAQPVVLHVFSTPQHEEVIPIWVMVAISAVCAVGGFILALVYRAKKKEGRAEGVY